MIKIDILVQPNQRTETLEYVIRNAAKVLNIEIQLNRTSNFAAYSNYAINPSQTPIIFINGSLEFAGKVPELEVFKKKLTEIKRLMP